MLPVTPTWAQLDERRKQNMKISTNVVGNYYNEIKHKGMLRIL